MAAQPSPTKGVPVWILETGSSNHLVSPTSLPKRLRGAIEQNAHAVRLATANGIIEATDVIDVDIQSLGAKARVLAAEHACRSLDRKEGPSRTTGAPSTGPLAKHPSQTPMAASTCARCATTSHISMLDVIMIIINILKTRAISYKRFRPERQMTASSNTRPQTWTPTWRAPWSPVNTLTTNSITFRSAQLLCVLTSQDQDEARSQT